MQAQFRRKGILLVGGMHNLSPEIKHLAFRKTGVSAEENNAKKVNNFESHNLWGLALRIFEAFVRILLIANLSLNPKGF